MLMMEAFADDFGKVTVQLSTRFFGGKTERFYLEEENGEAWDCVIRSIEERPGMIIYELITPSDLKFGVRYYIGESHGRRAELQYRYIVQKPEFDRLFTYHGNDLGAIYHPTYTTFAVWAPTAIQVVVRIRHDRRVSAVVMKRSDYGVWRAKWAGDLKKATYVYLITRNGEMVECPDPYGLSSTANGKESAVINLAVLHQIEDKPLRTEIKNPCDAVIYETNVRDLTSLRTGGSKPNGTYAAFIERGVTLRDKPVGLDYLVSLGVTHIQLQPVLDYVTVNELRPQWNYNWGYDAGQLIALEGSYSSSPNDPYARMLEMRKLVTTLHRYGLRVTLDLVFNHMYDISETALERSVPYYYFRYNDSGYLSNGSFCGNDLNSLKPMMRKLFLFSIRFLMETYCVDGFRFDLMGILDIDTMNAIYDTARSVRKDALVYGEGWDMPTALDDSLKAKIFNQTAMPGIGHFNDTFRDVLKGATGDTQKSHKGYLTGNLGLAHETCSVLSGNTLHSPYYHRFENPTQSINAIETHDNATAWDKMHACCSEEPRDLRKKRQKMMIACTMFAQGVPFLHAGQEFCGTKQDNSNSYNAGDAINGMNWERMIFNFDTVEYTKKAIALRKRFRAFRLESGEKVRQYLTFKVHEGGILRYDIRFPDADNGCRGLRVYINPSMQLWSYSSNDEWNIIFDENGNMAEGVTHSITVPPCTVIAAKLL